jgi:hypothetical protein
MRKLAAAGMFAAGVLGVSLQAGAATTTYVIDGSFAAVEQSCTQVNLLFAGTDCTYGRNRPGASPGKWQGPYFGGSHYVADGVKDQPAYVPTHGTNNPLGDPQASSFIPAVDDGKFDAPVTGQIIIDDNGTPGDATDDIISGTMTIGAMARNIATGQFTRAVEAWTTMDHVIAATAVNPTATIGNGAGGIDYIVGTRGFPDRLCFRYGAADCFPSQNSMTDFNDATFWADIPEKSIGIERSGNLGDPDFVFVNPAPNPPTGNLGATSTATFTGYTCVMNNGAQDDCVVNQLVWGGTVENPGFDNMVMKISTNNLGEITAATVYWSEEYKINLGPPPFLYDNSNQAGVITFTGMTESQAAEAKDFAASVLQGSTVNTLDTVGNSVNFAGDVTITIVTPPAQGTATVNGNQTINYDATGAPAGTQTIVYQATDGTDTDQGTITITVAANALPVAPDGSISISTQGAAPGAGTAGSVNVSTLPGYDAGNAPSVVSVSTPPNAASGTATVTGTTIQFTPAAAFFTGTDTIGYTLTDNDSDTDTGVITVTIPDVSPALSDGAITTDQDRASPALSLGITPGNGSVAQHTLAVTTAAANGNCSLSGTSVTYTPAAGYFGTDSCVVTITDGDGDADTGTISITVNEVSDDLKLPGGGSAVDPWSLALLGALPLLRRRRRA